MFYVYILLLSNKQLYTGYTKDLKRRVKEHQQGKVKSTGKRRPVYLIHYEAYETKDDARRRERFLKKTEGKRLLRQQLKSVLVKYRVMERWQSG